MKLKVFLLIAQGFSAENRWQMGREYFRIPPEMGNDSSMQHILVHDNVVVFWIFIHFIQFQLRQSNHVQYRNLQVSNRVNLSTCAWKIYRILWFSYFADIYVTFCELLFWEICIPRIVQAEEILIGCFVERQSIKKSGRQTFRRRIVSGPIFRLARPAWMFHRAKRK